MTHSIKQQHNSFPVRGSHDPPFGYPLDLQSASQFGLQSSIQQTRRFSLLWRTQLESNVGILKLVTNPEQTKKKVLCTYE
jgi:hypothetical protein